MPETKSIDIDARLVLKHLNELGYYEISAKQLKEFMTDLKTLIKHDHRKENKENIHPVSPANSYFSVQNNQNNQCDCDITDVATELNTHRNEKYMSDVFNGLYSTSTISSRAKVYPRSNLKKQDEQNVLSVELKPKSKIPFSSSDSTSRPRSEYQTKSSRSDPCNCKVSYPPSESEFPQYTERPKSSGVSSGNFLKTGVSFIRPRKPVLSTKSDPVALYQKYQEEWKKRKVPGEDRRYPLRWAIRERMMGEPDIEPRLPLEQMSRKLNRI